MLWQCFRRFALAAALTCAPLRALALDHRGEGRKTSVKDLAVAVQRVVLPNGLVVLLAPDATDAGVLVWMTFRAGTLYEPPRRSGLAHVVEHVMAAGVTPPTDYAALLERRRARYFNATTDMETMQFQTVVPPEELPLALWVAADRLGSLAPLVDDELVEHHRRVVLQERAVRDVDAPYGPMREQLFSTLFAEPHPLHGSVIGTVEELHEINGADVRAFVGSLLVPANAILTIVGRFDAQAALRLVEDGLGRLPAGQRAKPPLLVPLYRGKVAGAAEKIAREPAVTIGWRFAIPHQQAVALGLGAQLLSFMTDGAWGMRLSAALQENEVESLFTLDLTVPYDEPASVVQSDADGFLRMLTRRQMSPDLVLAANVVLDRIALFDLDTLEGRAERLTRLERLVGARADVADDCAAHWWLDPAEIRAIADGFLDAPRVTMHARPIHPRAARVGHDL
jgi:predicted Zn-dependent peptidase